MYIYYIYIYIYIYIHIHVFRPSQDSSVRLGLTSTEQLMSPEFSKHQVLSFAKMLVEWWTNIKYSVLISFLQSAQWIYIYKYICYIFRFDAKPKKLFVSCHYHVLFVCLAPVVFKVNTANIQYFWIFLDIQIMQDPVHTAVLTTIFSHDYSYQKYGLFFSFVDSYTCYDLILCLKSICSS